MEDKRKDIMFLEEPFKYPEAFRIKDGDKINVNGHDQYEAWREGIHDDIVLSAAMGVWLGSDPWRRGGIADGRAVR